MSSGPPGPSTATPADATTDRREGAPPNREGGRPPHPWLPWLAAGIGSAAIVLMVTVSGADRYLLTGDSDPGRLTSVLYVLLRFVAALTGALTAGGLSYALLCTRVDRRGRVGVNGYAGILLARRSSLMWALASAALIVVSASDSAGVSVASALRRGVIAELIAPSEQPKAWIVTTILAAVIATGTRWALSWVAVFWLTLAAVVATLPAAVVGSAGQGPDHDLGTSAVMVATVALSVWTGLAASVRAHFRRGTEDLDTALRRYVRISGVVFAATAATTTVLVLILLPTDAVVSTGYGRAVLVAAGLVLLAGGATVTLVRRLRRGSSTTRGVGTALAVCEGALVLVWAPLALIAVAPAPGLLVHEFTITDIFLGFDLPGPPSVAAFATVWRFDFVTGTAALALSALYVWGVVRLRRRGDHWPVGRTAAWLSGCAVLLIVTSSGVSAYGSGMFSVHMSIHMALNMFVPVLLVLGGPVTLALRALPPAGRTAVPGPREWIVATVHSGPTRILSHPGVAIGLFVVSLYGLYFSPLFDQLVRYHWGHELMNIHFLITGYLFYWSIIGIDPGPKRLPHLGRLGLLFAVMPFHAFFGIAVMTMNQVIGGTFYRYLNFPWLADLAADQRMGGGIAWASSEIPLVLVVAALVTQWARQDRRTEARQDRYADTHDDDELGAYNAMLAELARTRR
ncbi:cytochrome c oxidase assembly protein [Rhodococcus wratislaviensis]|uniref:cytochrome c oxidase assembly protein n=1 Tax=Rhodococcus wratislaviensis TaxID=44752 RepID=UPI0036469C7D